ncbi:MAG TPA: DUF6515 family protein [Verrucomicrobiae bacterium]|jgi:hypothetical protein|nr:DUF6515 family protein [Verrucomicrobiae bacterium]
MKTATDFIRMPSLSKTGRLLAVGLPALLLAFPLLCADRGAPRAAAPRAAVVDRTSHGSVRHVDTHVVQRPAPARPEPVRPEPARPVEVRPNVAPRTVVAPPRNVVVHRDVEADVHRAHVWDDFAFGRRLRTLPVGFLNFQVGGVPYWYDDGIYYQQATDGYQEVYPPVGAEIPEPPDGAIEIDGGGGEVYYYAGGAFYEQQADGSYAIVPTPIGVVVPELPPGAAPISINGTTAYQFNGIDYEPVFVNGVTQYQTFAQ